MAILTYDDFRSGPIGQKLASHLHEPEVVRKLEAASEEGRPAVAAIDEWAGSALPALGDTERQHAGRMVRDVLAERGWRVGRPDRPRLRRPRVFKTGAVYVRRDGGAAPDLGAAAGGTDRVARARAILAAGRLPGDREPDTVEAFLADRRASWGGE